MDDWALENRVWKLREVPLFAELSKESLQRIAGMMDAMEADAGEVLVQPNQEASGMFVIEEGIVAIEIKGKRIKDMSRGEFFGELALLYPHAARTARVVAKTPVRCLTISRDSFTTMVESEPKVALSMLSVLARRLAESN